MNEKQIKSANILADIILNDKTEQDIVYDCIDHNLSVKNTPLYHAMIVRNMEFEFWVMVNLYIRGDFVSNKTREDYDVR